MGTIHLKLPNKKQDEASLTERFLWAGGSAGWPVANRLQCNLHSCGWISDVGVLYKDIWLPAEQHDIQLAPCRVSTHTHMHSFRCTLTHWYRMRQRARQNSAWFICWIIKTRESSTPKQAGTDTLEAHYTSLSPVLALCVPKVPLNQGALALPLAQQLWYLPRPGPIMAVNPASASGTKHGA